jgi:hypothetical protein
MSLTVTTQEIRTVVNESTVLITPTPLEVAITISNAISSGSSGGISITLASRVSILGTTPTAGSLAFSTDTHEFFVYTGTVWYKASTAFIIDALASAAGLNFSIAANSQYIPMVN